MLWCNNWSEVLGNCLDYIENNENSTVIGVLLKVTEAQNLIEKYKTGCRSRNLYDEMKNVGKEMQ